MSPHIDPRQCTHCDPTQPADPLIDYLLHDCIYRPLDWIGFLLQLTSLASWLVCQVPQFVDNWKNESAEALSPWFLAEWFMGDSSNLLGCLLTGTQLPLTTGTAWYFVFCDIVMLVQYTFLAAKARRRAHRANLVDKARRRHHGEAAGTTATSRQPGGAEIVQSEDNAPGISQPHSRHMQTRARQVPLDGGMAQSGSQTPLPSDPTGVGCASSTTDGAMLSSANAVAHQGLWGAGPVAVAASRAPVMVLSVCCLVLLGSAGMAGVASGGSIDTPEVASLPWSSSGEGCAQSRRLQSEGWWHTQEVHVVPPTYMPHWVFVSPQSTQLRGAGSEPARRKGLASARDNRGDEAELPACPSAGRPEWAQRLGLLLGYFSAAAYLKSRISQLMKNVSSGDAEGLAVSMFLCAIAGNVFGAAGIMVRLQTWEQLLAQLPWLVGQLGTVAMDITIAVQAHRSNKRVRPAGHADDMEQALLVEGMELAD